MRVFKVWPSEGCCPFIEKNVDAVTEMLALEDAEIDTTITVKVLEMTEAEYEALPEYMGP